MLPRALRLTKDRDIKAVIHDGQLISTPHLRIYYLPSTDQSHSRLAVVVSKQVSASAVQRHQYQRWLRAATRPFLSNLSPPLDLVIIARPNLKSIKWDDLTHTLDLHLKPLI